MYMLEFKKNVPVYSSTISLSSLLKWYRGPRGRGRKEQEHDGWMHVDKDDEAINKVDGVVV